MFLKLEAIFVKQVNGTLKVVGPIRRIEVEANPERLLEIVCKRVNEQYRMRVHALRWADSLNGDSEPCLILHVDECDAHTFPTSDSNEMGFTERLRSVPDHEPWSEPAWLGRMEHWIRCTLPDIRSVSQVRAGSTGAVLKICASERNYFLKTVPRNFAHEIALLVFLNRTMPDTCARIIYVPDCTSHITTEVGGQPLYFTDDERLWKDAVRSIARFQLRCLEYMGGIRRTGVSCRSLECLKGQALETNIAFLVAAQRGWSGELTQREEGQISVLVDWCSKDCEILGQCNIPETLINHDLNQTNIFVTSEGQTTFIDWTFARVSHPFFGLSGTILPNEGVSLPPRLDCQSLVEEYLGVWRSFCSLPMLKCGINAASRLISVDGAIYLSELRTSLPEIGKHNISAVLRTALKAYDFAA